jgi:hypothetical protein
MPNIVHMTVAYTVGENTLLLPPNHSSSRAFKEKMVSSFRAITEIT